MISFRKVTLPLPGFALLSAEAADEGFDFVERLSKEWQSGANRFSAPGEALFAAFEGEELVAIGGLNCDPFLGDPATGRIRRVFVRAGWRNRRLGTELIRTLLGEARLHFLQVRLRAVSPQAARLYERLGFQRLPNGSATHLLVFKNQPKQQL